MKSRPNLLHTIARILAIAYVVIALPAQATLTDLTNQPLANVSGTAAVKPNIMFILDDSGSMFWDYSPDHMGDWNTRNVCFDYKDDNNVLTSWASGSSVTAADAQLKTCRMGDPPYMASQINKQYYNPMTRYLPALNADGSPMTSQNASNTSNWTQVRTDMFNVHNHNQYARLYAANPVVNYVNLVADYPDRVWCTSQADDPANTALCKRNQGYTYPNWEFGYGTTNGTNRKYVTGTPYYYLVSATEYCSTPELITRPGLETCQAQTAPDAVRPYPAIMRWCTNSSFTDCKATRGGNHLYPKDFGVVNPETVPLPIPATGSVTVGDSGSNDSVQITGITIGGNNVMDPSSAGTWGNVSLSGGVITASGGTNAGTERNNVAAAIVQAINAYSATSGFAASRTNNVVTVTATIGGSAPNGQPIVVTAPGTGVTAAYADLTVSSVANPSSIAIPELKVNGVSIIGGTINCNYNNTSGNRSACAANIRNAINSFTSSPNYTASGSGNTVRITAPLALGASANGWQVVETGTVGTNSPRTLANGVSRSIPTTVVNMAGGGDAVPTIQSIRKNVAPFTRVNIVSGQTYPKYPNRTDCAADPCSYEEEMTNFANWYAYYRTRMQMMKSAAGHAFHSISSDYRVGFMTINGANGSGTDFTNIGDFDETQKGDWYQTFYAAKPEGGTPLHRALSNAGRIFAGVISTYNGNTVTDPMQYSCQQNFSILTTDGYWNTVQSLNLSGNSIGNVDNTGENSDASQSPYCSRANGCYDGNLTGASNSLADVAAYYYRTDLRTSNCNSGVSGADVCTNNVPTTDKDPNPAQHMTTFTLGLGVDGRMVYRKDYETAAAGDFYRIRTGATDCAWTAAGATCNWPIPAADTETAVDDLWHAAVNGHGTYFSAKDPDSLSEGLASALAGLKVRNAAASASATSTPNVTQEDNDIFSATFRTVKWDGELIAQKIDTATGNLLPDATWSAQSQLDSKVANNTDSRIIYTADLSNPTPVRKNFEWGILTASERDHFHNKCTGGTQLSQCATLTADEKILANDGSKMVNYLRGHQEMENTDPPIYRPRDHVLGDIASAKPAYVRNPRRNYGDVGYSVFKAAQAGRQAMVYVAANDGFLHALNATTGNEVWAYVPHAIYPDFHKLADSNYGNNHRYYVDGSPESGDVYIGGQWRTLLVGGLNKGGRGYYALDITEPTNPLVLWEFCSDAALCSSADSDLGLTFGNPVITKRPSDGKWVVLVASGYNNVSPGTGRGYLFVLDAATGEVLSKIDTGAGDTTTPSGLARISGRAENAVTDNTATTIFGGDLLGNLWRFDMATNTVIKLASLTDDVAGPQPITTRPDVGKCHDTPMVFVGTGRYLGLSDLTNNQLQSVWGIRDSSTSLGTLRGNNIVQQTFSAGGGGTYTISGNSVDLASQNGWFVDLDQNTGERVNLDPALVLGTLLVVTNQPEDVSACSVGGNSFKYEFDFCSGKALLAAGGVVGKKIGSSIAVGFIVIRLPSGALKVITTFAGAEKTTEGVTAGSSGNTRRVSWRELQ